MAMEQANGGLVDGKEHCKEALMTKSLAGPMANGDAKMVEGQTVVANGGPLTTTDGTTANSDSSSDVHVPPDLQKRETWSRRIDFLLACIGFSVGLGNVWRFPYLCYKNGGGAFLLPYFICVLIAGVPMFFLEVSLGQFMTEGGIGAWRLCPLLQGIGYATTIIVFLLNIYYNVILAWAFYYLFSSFTSLLPWAHCGNAWNTPQCRVTKDLVDANSTNVTMATALSNITMATTKGAPSALNATYHTNLTNASVIKHVDPTTEFWERQVLQLSTGVDNMGEVKWDLALCLLLAWVVVYLCIWKGIKSSGKVMYFTATSPYILMTVLLIRGVTLPGAIDGIKFYLVPDWKKVMEPQVWVDAGTQIFFSYSISLGTLTALGSFNKFSQNCWKDSVLFACMNSGTSFFAGFVIFSVLGFMAREYGTTVDKVAESGPGLAFIAYPTAVAQMPVAPLWSILFFCMVILLGLDSQFVGVEGFVTAIVDQNARLLRRGYRKEIFIAVVCFISFLIGLPMVTKGGMYVFQLFDYYSGSRIILLVAFFECMAVAWCYGVKRFYDNIEMMLGFRLNPFMMISWTIVTPLFTLIMFGMCIYTYSELTYERIHDIYKYPKWAIVIGWMLASSSAMMIPAVMVYRLITTPGTFIERFKKLIRPRLKPHQMRLTDDPKDLMEEYRRRDGPNGLPNGVCMISIAEDTRPLNVMSQCNGAPLSNGHVPEESVPLRASPQQVVDTPGDAPPPYPGDTNAI